jgi:hypothetical protein
MSVPCDKKGRRAYGQPQNRTDGVPRRQGETRSSAIDGDIFKLLPLSRGFPQGDLSRFDLGQKTARSYPDQTAKISLSWIPAAFPVKPTSTRCFPST